MLPEFQLIRTDLFQWHVYQNTSLKKMQCTICQCLFQQRKCLFSSPKSFVILKRARNTIACHSSSFMLLPLSKCIWQNKINSWERLRSENLNGEKKINVLKYLHSTVNPQSFVFIARLKMAFIKPQKYFNFQLIKNELCFIF